MEFKATRIIGEEIAFGLISVSKFGLLNSSERVKYERMGREVFGDMPIILMAYEKGEPPQYYGRKDVVEYLADVNPNNIPWKTYTSF